MRQMSRRRFVGGFGAATATAAGLPSVTYAQASPRVVIIGGGAGGATVARYLKRASPNIHVTLIERNAQFTTCFFSNLYLGGFRSIESITHSYTDLRTQGVNVLTDVAVDVDTAKKNVTLMSGSRIGYDRLVLSPGIDIKYDTIEGYSSDASLAMPHAWRAGEQTRLLKNQLDAMPDGGVVVMAAPPNPYRCPPGPYERACMIAHFLKTRKPRSKLIVLDPKRTISKQAVFLEAFKKYYADIVELHLTTEIDNFQVVSVDASNKILTTKGGHKVKAAVANIIPAQRAGSIAYRAGCTEGDWCPISPDNFLSTKAPDVHVIGDASIATDMPKSGFSANSHAKLIANFLAQTLTGKEVFPGRVRNTCWSLLAANDSVKIGANYIIGEKDGKKVLAPTDAFVSEPGEDAAERQENFEESLGWYSGITTDMFGQSA